MAKDFCAPWRQYVTSPTTIETALKKFKKYDVYFEILKLYHFIFVILCINQAQWVGGAP